ncbi:MAG: tetratricopeptide repeat-containing glycosyltransferase family protein, partial [Gammaproteobacteria bacterium]|nr:tetratricopeptide repeat-containing glycosyltransferase family protein [Gammaproteobacteria bacterium]
MSKSKKKKVTNSQPIVRPTPSKPVLSAKDVKISQEYLQTLLNEAQLFESRNDWEAALDCYQKSLLYAPHSVQIMHACAICLLKLNRLEQALQTLDQAIKWGPQFAQAHSNRGLVLSQLNRNEEAVISLLEATKIRPDYAEAHNNLGAILMMLGRKDEACKHFLRATECNPNAAQSYINLGVALHDVQRFDQAKNSFEQGMRLNPNAINSYTNYANLCSDVGKLDYALKIFNAILLQSPQDPEIYWNKALTMLQAGLYLPAWSLYEVRWFRPGSAVQPPMPLWIGKENLSNKRILLYSEQGVGDTIMLSRYIPLVVNLGAKVYLRVQASVQSLLQNIPGIVDCINEDNDWEQYLPLPDFQTPFLSLPLAFGTSIDKIPNPIGVLPENSSRLAKWRQILEKSRDPKKPLVGIVWSGSRTHRKDHLRSIPLTTFLHFLPENCQYLALAKEILPDELKILNDAKILHYPEEIVDFSDTQAICSLLSCVVTVDTAVAHLSGTMGFPTLVLLGYTTDWRWMKKRTDSPWYPSVKLYRQPKPSDWSAVGHAVFQTLSSLKDHQNMVFDYPPEQEFTDFSVPEFIKPIVLNTIPDISELPAIYQITPETIQKQHKKYFLSPKNANQAQ